jgi:hypothetical protein
MALRSCAEKASAGDLAGSAWQAGWAACAGQLAASIAQERKAPEPRTEDTTFVDPAMKPTRVKRERRPSNYE